MKISFKASFHKDLKLLRHDAKLFARVKEIIQQIEAATSIDAIGNMRKIKSDGTYYRIRSGDYRLGVILEGDMIIFVRILHRSRIYRYFP